jgi:hypothetical protein
MSIQTSVELRRGCGRSRDVRRFWLAEVYNPKTFDGDGKRVTVL